MDYGLLVCIQIRNKGILHFLNKISGPTSSQSVLEIQQSVVEILSSILPTTVAPQKSGYLNKLGWI